MTDLSFEAIDLELTFGDTNADLDAEQLTGELSLELDEDFEFDVDQGEDAVYIQFWEEDDI